MPPRPLLIALLLSFCTPAFAIYKCETNGRVSYNDTPCPESQHAKHVNTVNASPLSSDSAQAQRQLTQEKNQVRQLQQERRQRETAENKQQDRNARTYAVKQKKCASSALHKKWAKEDAAQATGKSASKATRKARRAAEKYELECGK
jgi:hypothetical protein